MIGITRTGTFPVGRSRRKSQCRRPGADGEYEYEVCIETADSNLDEYDFIIDNAAIDGYFKKMLAGRATPSCEKIAIMAVDHFKALWPASAPLRIRAKVRPIEEAFIECRYERNWDRVNA